MGQTKRLYEIKGLHCVNCASKIEHELNQLPYVQSAVVNSLTSKAILEVEEELDKYLIFNDVESIATRIEYGVTVKEIDENSVSKKPIKAQENNEDHHSHDHGHSHHGKSFKKKRIIKFVIAISLAIGGILTKDIISLVFFIAAYLVIGGDILLIAGKNIVKGQVFDENFLMSIATIGAFLIGEYPEAIGVMLFYQVGELFQELAVNKSRDSISELMDIRPDHANLKLSNGDISSVSPEEIYIDDIIIVKPGEKIPLDGVIVKGDSQIDTSALTGESVPRVVKERDEVLAGSINKTSLIEVRVNKEFSESTVSKILELVENASNKKAPTEKFITKFARYYTPIVVVLAILLAF